MGEQMREAFNQSEFMSYAFLLSAPMSESNVDADSNAMQRHACPMNE